MNGDMKRITEGMWQKTHAEMSCIKGRLTFASHQQHDQSSNISRMEKINDVKDMIMTAGW